MNHDISCEIRCLKVNMHSSHCCEFLCMWMITKAEVLCFIYIDCTKPAKMWNICKAIFRSH